LLPDEAERQGPADATIQLGGGGLAGASDHRNSIREADRAVKQLI